MKFPLVLRKTMEKAIKKEMVYENRLILDHKDEMEELTKQLDECLPKLVKFAFKYRPNFDNYMVQVAFSTEMIRNCFIHGDSQFMIKMLSERLGHQIEHEMRTINFARLGEERYEPSRT